MVKKRGRGKKMKGGGITDETFTVTQVISIILLVIALILGIMLYFQKRRIIPWKQPPIRYRNIVKEVIKEDRPSIAPPININIDDGKSFYEEKVERRLEPPGVVYEPDRYMPRRYIEPRPMPINIRTRGSPSEYQQIGILTNGNNVRPLYGRQTYRGSNQWNYYSSLDSNLSTKIPIFKSSDKCTDERGCREINDGDNVTIGNVDTTEYVFTKYSNDSFRYIPDVF